MRENTKGRLEGRTAIVTGSTYGIGEAIAKVLADEGAISIVTGRTEEEGERVAGEIRSSGRSAEYHHLDVTDEEEVVKVMRAVYEKYGRIDILVNNAGISGPSKPTHEYTREEWERVFDVNVTGAFLCTKNVIPYMKRGGGGNIVYISSIYGIVGSQDNPAYHATKAANRIMAKTGALIYAKNNVRVNSVHPGFIWTPMVEDFLKDQSRELGVALEDLKGELDARHPIGHVGEPNDIAYGVLYLVSDEAKFVTGSELIIDGGYTTR
ncbi:MAG: glucose 1-dehydrogenase [Methanothrix sp.]|jgi:Dehydrogenases with different specificities (related to short-chain alcohol dehydrogenases)|uniref:2,3-dihydro-2,3-dihydroxybenzoate dehydrogenase (Coldshock protein CSI14) n=1 Tax=Methanothrix harundinacea TaxID=301375 RepID=A0A124FM69_9EURY|nr:MAG: short-chain dehydrogenase [Methanosaeta sp. SDB]KUK43838.1 MAG: 2,3-dihydro-2,3-dihydroxybenzoate dehydrogenase (Coldshock protein CSI14) [Methanothrix harundinacea]MDD2639280.1 glucose 1-dehydrogenase [Methanothrix sp.]MDI9399883.1 glucose 1-dehydrogenase [Euryarchaeota archaeon]KUK97544.1 MAG: 2,3-dihydro-2,3-dihydroxybenzoate dehydrogenase (Coldshock protein CSI14) [Methanothrix harundinacea]